MNANLNSYGGISQMELKETGRSGRKRELITATIDYVGEEIFEDFMLTSEIIQELTDAEFSVEPPEEDAEFVPPLCMQVLHLHVIFGLARVGALVRPVMIW